MILTIMVLQDNHSGLGILLWLLLIWLVPFLGVLLYLLFGQPSYAQQPGQNF